MLSSVVATMQIMRHKRLASTHTKAETDLKPDQSHRLLELEDQLLAEVAAGDPVAISQLQIIYNEALMRHLEPDDLTVEQTQHLLNATWETILPKIADYVRQNTARYREALAFEEWLLEHLKQHLQVLDLD